MPINFSKLVSLSNHQSIEPRDIFMALPDKDRSYGYPRDVQTEVWKQWFTKRSEKNVIIKMNTGSGKTIVGLTILQSCLNEGKGSAVYIVPDNYLVQQVCCEAKKLGILVACDVYDESDNKIEKGEDNYHFTNGKAILVANIHKLVNGKSVFGMRQSGNVKIGSIIIDDVHACLDTIEQRHTIFIESAHKLYGSIIKIFSVDREVSENQTFCDIIGSQDPRHYYLLPFWVWQKHSMNIYKLLTEPEFSSEPFVMFNLPLLRDNWKTCNCVISVRGIELTMKGIPNNKISSFEQAQRRIFMSATLADDSVFVSTIGLKHTDIENIITPEKADDLGERLILFLKHLNPKITDEHIKQILKKLSTKANVVVIVPSFERVSFWSDVQPQQVLSSRDKNIVSGITLLKNGGHIGLTILVNKYDGIDLPDDACRILVIDGLPAMRSGYDIVIQSINPNDKRICREQIQKIEQGMGRGVRSNSDYCVIVFMGDKLADAMANQDGDKFFSKATYEQLSLSRQLWEQLMESEKKPQAKEVFSLTKYILLRDPEWINASKSRLAMIEYNRSANVDSIAVAMRNAFEKECIERYDEAFSIIETEMKKTDDEKTKGLLIQYMAEYRNFTNPAHAQELLLSARNLNPMVLKPITGIQFERLQCSPNGQAAYAIKHISDNGQKINDYLIYVDSILGSLIFLENSANQFEQALKNVASVIGIYSSRPEVEYGGIAPDNLFALENSEYAVIECKNGTTTENISKHDCEQLLSSVQWFKNHYMDRSLTCYPIMIHNSKVFSYEASPSSDMRIMTPELLSDFCSAVKKFSEAIVQNDVIGNIKEVEKLLSHLELNGKQIIQKYTVTFSKKTRT
jgi:hypothetical protein